MGSRLHLEIERAFEYVIACPSAGPTRSKMGQHEVEFAPQPGDPAMGQAVSASERYGDFAVKHSTSSW
jgi:hypothetical protein